MVSPSQAPTECDRLKLAGSSTAVRYSYEVVALYGDPKALKRGASVEIAVYTELESGSDHNVFFNRGSPATQEYARRFRNQRPSKAGPGAYEWLSRGLVDGIAAFVQRAEGPGWSLRDAFDEFQWPAALAAFSAARDCGVKVSIVFDAVEGASGPRPRNIEAIGDAGLSDVTVPPTKGKLMHNKFIVLMHDDETIAVLLGSTNLAENGLFGQRRAHEVPRFTQVANAVPPLLAEQIGWAFSASWEFSASIRYWTFQQIAPKAWPCPRSQPRSDLPLIVDCGIMERVDSSFLHRLESGSTRSLGEGRSSAIASQS